MKTKLIINDDLKKYLLIAIDRSQEGEKEIAKKLGRECFNWQWIFKFSDKYGVSVIKNCWGSYGFDDDLFELATLSFHEGNWGLCGLECMETNPVGYLTNNEVMEYLYKIKEFIEGEDKNEN